MFLCFVFVRRLALHQYFVALGLALRVRRRMGGGGYHVLRSSVHAFPGPGMNLHVHRKNRCPPPFFTPPLFFLHEALPSSARLLLFCRSSRRDKPRGALVPQVDVDVPDYLFYLPKVFEVPSLVEILKGRFISCMDLVKCAAK